MRTATRKLLSAARLLAAAGLLYCYAAAAQEPRRDAGAAAATIANSEREALARAAMQSAAAALEPLSKERPVHGTVQFFGGREGMAVHVRLTGATRGLHGFHIHESTDCVDAERAERSSHFNPRGRPHGAPGDSSERRHAGDLGNVLVGVDGTADQWLQSRELTLHGELGIVGRTVVLHAREDDLRSQPEGESGPGVACGVIRMTPIPG